MESGVRRHVLLASLLSMISVPGLANDEPTATGMVRRHLFKIAVNPELQYSNDSIGQMLRRDYVLAHAYRGE